MSERNLALNLAHQIDAATPYRPGERPLVERALCRPRFGLAWVPLSIAAAALVALVVQ